MRVEEPDNSCKSIFLAVLPAFQLGDRTVRDAARTR